MFALTRTNRRNGLTPFDDLFESLLGAAQPATSSWVPALDFAETPDAYVVTAELPGVDPSSVEISLEEDRLELSGEKVVEGEETKEGWYRAERRRGAFRRALRLPGAVEPAQVKAESRHGVLTITLPKAEQAKARKIPVEIS